MFLTEINIFFQSFSSDFLTAIFRFFSFVGSANGIILLIIVIMFGIHFRIGTFLIHLAFWNGVITDFLKDVFALPRPFNVDAAVLLPGEGAANPTPFKGMGAKHFFGALPGQVVDYFREHGVWLKEMKSFGLPSGHTSSAVALWGAIFLIFKNRWVRIIAVLCVVFIPLSRLYLGRHFLADVLAGFLLGLIVLILFYKAVFRNERLKHWLFEKVGHLELNLRMILFLVYCLLFPFLLLLVPGIMSSAAPALLGLNCGFFLLWLRGLPAEGGTLPQRLGRATIVIVFYFGLNIISKNAAAFLFSHQPGIAEFIRQALVIFLLIWGATEVNIKLGLYKR